MFPEQTSGGDETASDRHRSPDQLFQRQLAVHSTFNGCEPRLFVTNRCFCRQHAQLDRVGRILVHGDEERVRVALECVRTERACDFRCDIGKRALGCQGSLVPCAALPPACLGSSSHVTALGGLGHAVPYLVPDSWPRAFWIATTIAGAIVFVELWTIAFIRARYMDTPFLQAAFQIVLGGVIVLGVGILIGGS